MKTAVDTNIIFDLISPDSVRFEASSAAIDSATQDGDAVICEVVLAEIAGRIPPNRDSLEYLKEIGLTLVPSSTNTLLRAGRAWVNYTRSRPAGLICGACGAETQARCSRCEATISVRQRVLPDFLVGAHALEQADRLLTRDKNVYRTYFPDLELV